MSIKNELQFIIWGNEQIGNEDQLKTVQRFLRRNAEICYGGTDKKSIKRKEEECLLNFAAANNLFYSCEISDNSFIAEGAEQKVYRFNELFDFYSNDIPATAMTKCFFWLFKQPIIKLLTT